MEMAFGWFPQISMLLLRMVFSASVNGIVLTEGVEVEAAAAAAFLLEVEGAVEET